MQDVLAIILGGGRGARLFPLTHPRSKPAVPIGGKYRLIDIPISSCLHSGIRRILVLTQFNSASLNRHIAQGFLGPLEPPVMVDLTCHGQHGGARNVEGRLELDQLSAANVA